MQMQAKLKIGQPGDRYEQEADRVAEQVMRMPEPQAQRKAACASCADKDEDDKLMQTKPLAEQITPLVQRKPGPEAEKKDEDDDELVQAKSASGIGNAQEVHHPLIQSVLASPGQPLDAGTRSFMEPRFGQDFSGVRVHVGGQAAESARAVNARAYTVGRDVVFGEGQYAPGSDEGKRLVAHELTHVLQQCALITAPPIQCQDAKPVPSTTGEIDPLLRKILEGAATDQEREALRARITARGFTEAEKAYVQASLAKQIRQQLPPGLFGLPEGESSLAIDSGGQPSDRELCYRFDAQLHLSGKLVAVKGFEGHVSTMARITAHASDQSARLEIDVPTGSYRTASLARQTVFSGGPLGFDLGKAGYKGLGMLTGPPASLSFEVVGPDTEAAGSFVIRSPDVPSGARLAVTMTRTDSCSPLPDEPVNYGDTIPPGRVFSSGGVGSVAGNSVGVFGLGLDVPLIAGDYTFELNDHPIATVPDLGYIGIGVRVDADTRGVLTLGGSVFTGLNLQPLRFQLGFNVGAQHLPDNVRGPELPEWNLAYGLEGIFSYQVLEHLDLLARGSVWYTKDVAPVGAFQLGVGIPFF